MPDEMKLENALAIVGDEDIVLGFRALGFRVYAVKEPGEVKTILGELIENKTGVCLMQDNLYLSAQDVIEEHVDRPLPVVIPFSKDGAMDKLDRLVADIRLRATGTMGL